MKLAVAQTVPRAGDVDANLREHLALAKRAADRGASLVLFPELSLTGYELGMADDLAFDIDDDRFRPLRALSDERALTIVAGAPVRLEGALHIAAPIAAPGAFQLYTKRFLGAFAASAGGAVPPPEDSVFEAGERDPAVSLGDLSAAIGICADTARAAHAERASARGAAVYLASAFVIESDYAADTARLAGYAERHSWLVALANFGGPSGGLPSAGRSAIWGPTGAQLASLPPTGAGIAMVERREGGAWQACSTS